MKSIRCCAVRALNASDLCIAMMAVDGVLTVIKNMISKEGDNHVKCKTLFASNQGVKRYR